MDGGEWACETLASSPCSELVSAAIVGWRGMLGATFVLLSLLQDLCISLIAILESDRVGRPLWYLSA